MQNNVILALRDLFGPNLRAEIVFCLLRNTNLAIKNISKKIGYAYSPVYNEIELLIKSGFVIQEKGQWHSLHLSRRTKKILSAFG